MAFKKKPQSGQKIGAKARQVLKFAKELASKASDWIEMSNGLFAPDGKATLAFGTEAERTAFCKTEEYKQILALMDQLPHPPVKEIVELRAAANCAISVGLRRNENPAG